MLIDNYYTPKTILVSATPIEHGGLKEVCGIPIYQVGIGKINSAMNMMNLIHEHKPELVINFGSCGNLKNNKIGGKNTLYRFASARPSPLVISDFKSSILKQ